MRDFKGEVMVFIALKQQETGDYANDDDYCWLFLFRDCFYSC